MARYLLTLDSGVHANDAAAEAAIVASGASVVKKYSFSLTFEVEATAEQLAAIAGVVDSLDKGTPTVVTVQVANQDHLTHLATTTYPQATFYNPDNTGSGGHVYLVDTGLYAAHEQFTGRNINNLYSNFDGDFSDNSGHGTAVASVIVGNTQGVAKDATLHVVKLFDTGSGSITIGEILDALDAVLVHHQANAPSQAKVVCLPWTTPQNNFLDNKITEMNASNLVVVAAAGNDGVDVNSVSPAGVESIITVGAVNSSYLVGSFTNVPWTNPTGGYFNNYGAALDLFALGVDVSCAIKTAPDAYDLVSGTSIAAGIAAGAAVQWAAKYPSKTSAELKDTILQEGHLRGAGAISFATGSPAAASSVYLSVVTTILADVQTLSNLPSGRVLNVQFGQSATKDLEININAVAELGTLDFAPLPPWATLDLETGILTVDTANISASLSPGIYLFGIKGIVDGKTQVEEYAIGLYNSNVSELEAASQFYYDTSSDSYDEVIAYQVAPSSGVVKN